MLLSRRTLSVLTPCLRRQKNLGSTLVSPQALVTSDQSPITNHQSPVASPQSPVTSHCRRIPNHQLPITNYQSPPLINLGVGHDITIRELAELVAEVVGFSGKLEFDTSKPDGTPQKLLDISRIMALGWSAKTSLRDGLQAAYRGFLSTTKVPSGASIEHRKSRIKEKLQ